MVSTYGEDKTERNLDVIIFKDGVCVYVCVLLGLLNRYALYLQLNSPLGQCEFEGASFVDEAAPPCPALPSPSLLAPSPASHTNTLAQITGQPQLLHLRDREGSRLCDRLSLTLHSCGGGGGKDPKPLGGKTGSAPSGHP